MRAPLSPKWTIFTWLGAGRYNRIKADPRPRCGGLLNPDLNVGVCLVNMPLFLNNIF